MKDSILRIDFRAALAKLAPAQLQGSWQLPTELTRLAIASGAQSVALEIRKSRLVIQAPGARLDPVLPLNLRTLLDENAPESERHRALVLLEEQGGLALAALAGIEHEALDLRGGGQGAPFELRISGLRLDATAAEHWLRRNARFASLPITIGGQALEQGFQESLIRIRLRQPLPARLALARRGDVPRLWLLRHGIISTRATVPGYPAFEAAVEMAAITPPGATSVALREAVQPYLESLVKAAVSLIAQLARHADSLRDDARQRAACLLLEALRREHGDEHGDRHGGNGLRTIRIFPQIVHEDGTRRLVSIADLEYLIRFDARVTRLDAFDPDQSPDDFAVTGRQVLVLSRYERTLLGEMLQVSFVTPPPRLKRRMSLRRMAEELRGRLSLTWQRVSGRLVSDEELTASERTFLTALGQATTDGWPREIVFNTGHGRIHLTGDGRLLLPRRHPVVEASIRALECDTKWLYPVFVGLLGGHDLPSPEVRARWTDHGSELSYAPSP